MRAVRNAKVWFSTDIHPFYTFFSTVFTYAELAPEYTGLGSESESCADMDISVQKLLCSLI